MKTASPARNDLTNGGNGSGSERRSPHPHIEIDAKTGTLRVNDPRLITKDRRAFCRRLVHAVASRPGVSKTMIDLASASCRVEFAPGSVNRDTMAVVFADAVGEASAASLDGDGTPWWQPSTNWVALSAYSRSGHVSLWETLEVSPGRIRVRHQGLAGDFERLSRVAEALTQSDTVQKCQAIPWSHRLTIDFQPENGVADWFLDQAERSFAAVLASEAQQVKSALPLVDSTIEDGSIHVAGGPARWLYLALGGGALVMTGVGLIVPGIPTVPFLLLSGYGFAHSSPRMNQWLRETRFLGPILIEWEQHGGLSWSSKRKLIGLTVVVMLVAVALALLSPLWLALILLMASISAYGLYRLPGIPDEERTAVHVERPTIFALPAP